MNPWPRRLLEALLTDDDWSREFLEALDHAWASEREGARLGATAWWLGRLMERDTVEFVARVRRRRSAAPSTGVRQRRWGMGGAIQDFAHAARSLARDRRVTASVVLTLALGIGANAALYGVADRLFLRGPAHVAAPSELVRVLLHFEAEGGAPARTGPFIPWNTSEAVASAGGFAGITRYGFEERLAAAGDEARPARVATVDGAYFRVLGASPARGRWFAEASADDGLEVAVVSADFAARTFGSVERAVGRSVDLDGRSHPIVGVAPEGFSGPHLDPVDLWVPLDPDVTGNRNWLVVGRLADPDAGFAARERVADAADAAHRATDPGRFFQWAADGAVTLAPVGAGDDGARPPEVAIAAMLLGVSVLVLLIGVANVVNLLLLRLSRRRREVAVRLALGIGRGRLARFLFIENLVLAGLSGLVALPVAWGAGGLLRSVLLPGVAWAGSALPWRVVALTVATTLATAVMVSLVPLARAGRTDLAGALRSGGRGAAGARGRLQLSLATAQITLSAALLLGAGLFLESFRTLRVTDLGVDADRIIALTLRESEPGAIPSPSAEEHALYLRALEALREAPGVEAAAVTLGLPFLYNFGLSVAVPGRDSVPELPGGGPWLSAVSADYFAATGTGILRGRGFTEAEVESGALVAVVSEAMARSLWPGEEVLGACLQVGSVDDPCSRVVGVAEDVHRTGYREPPSMQFYVPLAPGGGFGGMALVVRTASSSSGTIAGLRDRLDGLDPAVGFVDATVLQRVLDPQIRPWRMGAWVLGLAAGMALLVAVLGVYGVLSYLVERRRREMGVRIALGASGKGIRGLVLKQGLGAAGMGLLLGIGATVAAGRWIEPLLFETEVTDAGVLTAVLAILTVTATAACLLPAGRAARVEPILCLRDD
ncbi:ABC transporter permease [Gemmatimonadota bacterium Y43]|uniref:ABC transporter permease n=1 Tax=Gaopeijia maritima TaxID=3119007 RepID=UPI00326D4465